ncbi:MAG: hypothetical protein ACO3A4_12625 [Silvanigrellaceae bacterium]
MFQDNSHVLDLLDAFERFTEDFPSDIPWCVDIGPKSAPFTTVIGSAIHGNETGSIPAVLAMLGELAEDASRLKGRYLFFIGNPTAVRAGTRFIERDLNRCFQLTDSSTLEGKRSHEIAKALSAADLFVDYHQTNQPAVFPFFTFAWHEESYFWASHMQAAQHFVTRDMRIAFSTEGMCGDEWLRSRGKPAVTLELGKAGLSHDAHQLTLNSLRRVIGFVENELEHNRRPIPSKPSPADDLLFFEVAAKIPWPGEDASLLPGYENFQHVTAGTLLGFSRPGEKILSPMDGFLMFPKYPKRGPDGKPIDPQGGDIVQIIRKLEDHPRVLWN